MNKNELMKVINSDFPEYKIINIEEIGLPIFKKEVVCLATISKGLPVVMDFALKLINLNYDIETISKMLALDFELVKHAIYDLELNNMIELTTMKVTEDGKKYLAQNSYKSMKRVELPICIDTYTGEITKNKHFISNKQAKFLNLNTIKPVLDKSNNSNINGSVIKNILKEYIKETNSDYEGELVGIVKIKDKSSEYKRLSIAVLESPLNQLRYVVYDRNIMLPGMENKIISADEAGISIFKIVSQDNLKAFKIDDNILSISKVEEGNYIEILNTDFFKQDNLMLTFVIPLVEVYKIEADWINSLERYLKRNLKVSIKFTGTSYPTAYYKNRVLELLHLQKKYNTHLSISHNIEFEYASILVGNQVGYIDKIELHNLDMKTNKLCIRHETLSINPLQVQSIGNEVLNLEVYENEEKLNLDIQKLIRISKELDVQMEETYGLNWLIGGQILNEKTLLQINLATNEKKFSDFTKILTSSFVEVLQKVGESQELKNYMFNEFKQSFPSLFDSLNRLRLYRNSMQHNDLDEKNLKAYLFYIEKDLEGQFPEFIDKGYLYLQKLIISKILESAEATMFELSSLV